MAKHTDNFMKFGLWFLKKCKWADRHMHRETHRHTDRNTLYPFRRQSNNIQNL